jgi:radical SAM-linked protein
MLGDKLRFRFSKTGTLRLLSHHDLMRCLERMLRRAALPFKSTAGFHPTPRIVFALSLPLGVVGRAEVLEVELTRPCDSDEVLAKMNAQAPDGLAFARATVVPMKATAIPRRVMYTLPIPRDREEAAVAGCRELMAEEQVWVDRLRPNPKKLNIRPYLRSLTVSKTAADRPRFSTSPPPCGGKVAAERSAAAGEGVNDCTGECADPLTRRRSAADLSPARRGRGEGWSALSPEPDGSTQPGLSGDTLLSFDLWVTQTGTARADELVRLLGLTDLLEAGATLERTTVELRDEVTNPDPSDGPPDGPAETLPLDPAAVAAAVREDENQPAGAHWGASPSGPVVE